MYRTSNSDYGTFFSSQNDPFLLGFANLGNTCYMNSALQCLLNIPQLSAFFSSPSSILKRNHKCEKLISLLRQLVSGDRKSLPEFLREFVVLKPFQEEEGRRGSEGSIGRKEGGMREEERKRGGGRQEDAQEFVKNLLELIHDGFNKAKNIKMIAPKDYDEKSDVTSLAMEWEKIYKNKDDSIITDLFYGQMVHTLTCGTCGKITKIFENFWEIFLDFNENDWNYTIESMLRSLQTGEQLEKVCQFCGKTKIHQKNQNWHKLPEILQINVKRFWFDGMSRVKLKCPVSFNYLLSIPLGGEVGREEWKEGLREEIRNEERKERRREEEKENQNWKPYGTSTYSVGRGGGGAVEGRGGGRGRGGGGGYVSVDYELIGVIHHFGEAEYGHYIADCRNNKKKIWNRFDDEIVKGVDIKNELKDSESVYVLFYQRMGRGDPKNDEGLFC